jgi:membrane-bound lytic murein transglycosylase B
MRLVRVVTWVVVAAAAVVPADRAHPEPRQTDRQPATQAREPATVAIPEMVSFDDLAPTVSAAVARPTSPSPGLGTSTTKLTHPPRTGADGSSPPAGTPQAVLAAAYRKAVTRVPAGCHLQTAHLAAIGQVESGSIGGRSVTADHRVSPAIYGPLLDGGPFAVIHDTDGGRYDGAGDYDRAMGPLQFLPGTWSWAGRDGDGDGRRDPQNVFDAALATADYLCDGGRDLARSADLRAAVLSYNQSGAYHTAVLEWVSYFQRHGLAAMATAAFRVGSGGRASAMEAPTPDPSPPSTSPAPTTPSRTGAGPTAPPTTDDGTDDATDDATPPPASDPTSPASDPTSPSSDPTTSTPTATPTPTTAPTTPTQTQTTTTQTATPAPTTSSQP